MVKESVYIISSLDTKHAKIELRSDGIVCVLFNEDITIDIPDQYILMENYRKLIGDEKHPFLYEAMTNVNFTKEARDNSVKLEEVAPVFASAGLVHTLSHRLIGNFYLRFNKPKIPFKLFKKREEAIKWLIEQKRKYENEKGAV